MSCDFPATMARTSYFSLDMEEILLGNQYNVIVY